MPASYRLHAKRLGIKTIGALKQRNKATPRFISNPAEKNSEQRTGSEGMSSNPDDQMTESEGLISKSNQRTELKDFTSNTVLPDQKTGSEGDQRTESEVEKPSKWVQFGPTYGEDTEVNQRAKDSAWQHILTKSDGNVTMYLGSIAEIEREAMENYDSKISERQKRAPHELRWMMVKDGCFFLQLALHILGGAELLDYPPQHPYFGKNSDSSSWIPAMFFVGNQIPCLVISALMKQTFFQGVIKSGRWQRPTDDLAKLVLFQTVVEPHLCATTQLRDLPSIVLLRLLMSAKLSATPQLRDPPSNILHALHDLLLGSGDDDPIFSEMRDFRDLEAGGEDSAGVKFPSAGELKKSGIKLKKAERGITNIHFKNRVYSAYLHLPPFTIDGYTEHLLRSLVELEQRLSESDRELTAYLRFMRDLAPTYKDFKILEKKGIFLVKDDKLKGSMVHVLDTLVSRHNSSFTLNFRQIRRRIKDYGGPPWRLISFALGVLAVVQTIFTVLSYFIPRT